ncbi:MAG: toast rack family protein [Chloroflexota bacterium]
MDSNNRSMKSGMVAQVQSAGYTAQPVASRRRSGLVAGILAGLVVMAVLVAVWAVLWLMGATKAFDRLASVKVGPLLVESNAVPVGKAEAVAVTVEMGQGTLTLQGGAGDLLNADFNYNVNAWKPIVTYNESSTQGALNIGQAHSEGFIRTPDGVRNDWSLRLKDGLPMTLSASLGAGSSTIKLDGLSVSKLDLSSGAGETTLDLTGNWKHNLEATLRTGIGDTTIRLPQDVGVRLTIDGGLSNVSTGGLNHNGKYYTNDAYGKTPVTVEITVQSGIGSVKIER